MRDDALEGIYLEVIRAKKDISSYGTEVQKNSDDSPEKKKDICSTLLTQFHMSKQEKQPNILLICLFEGLLRQLNEAQIGNWTGAKTANYCVSNKIIVHLFYVYYVCLANAAIAVSNIIVYMLI